MEHAVYKITGPNTSLVYYGYVGGDGTNAMATFLVGASRKAGDRGDMMMLEANNGDATTLVVEIVEKVEGEMLALMRRNFYRALDPNRITGPSNYPAGIHRLATKQFPELAAQEKRAQKLAKCKTARDAFALKAWSYQDVKMSNASRIDLDTLSPMQFVAKYNLPFDLSAQEDAS